jgi:hypothetical protein
MTMAKYGWTQIHYENPFPLGETPTNDIGAWQIGLYTGPDNKTLCVKICTTAEDAVTYASPRASNLIAAIIAARCLLEGKENVLYGPSLIIPPLYRVDGFHTK